MKLTQKKSLTPPRQEKPRRGIFSETLQTSLALNRDDRPIKLDRIQMIIEGLGLTRMGKLRKNATGSEIHEELERLLGTQMK